MAIDLSAFHGPAGCREALERSGSLLLTGRSSMESGKIAYRAAVQDLLQAADVLEQKTGLQVVSVLPARDVLERMLRGAPAIASVAGDGRRFTNRYLQWSDHPRGIHVLVSAGSGRKVDENLLQPALARTAEVIRALRPGLLFAKRMDRIGRRVWAFGPLMELMESTGAWMGDEDGLRPPDEMNSFYVFMTASRGQTLAEKMPLQTRHGMASRTGTQMVDGRVAYHVAQPPPPGTTRLGMLSPGGGRGETLLVLDSPAYLPPESAVATGLPQVFNPDGTRTDQVENVRWALSVFGRPQWSRRAIAIELSRRQTSTGYLRGATNSAATVQLPAADATVFPILNSILNHLDLYESGRLTLKLSVEGIDDLAIAGVMPTDGPWATSEDFTRIRRWLRAGKERHDRNRSLSLTSVPATLSGQPARLLSSAPRHHAEPGYAVTLRERPSGRQPRESREPIIPHAALAGSIVDAIRDAGSVPLTLWQSPDAHEGPQLAAISRLEMLAESTQTAMRAILKQVTAVDDAGDPRLCGALLEDLNREYARLAEHELPAASGQLAQAKQELEVQRISRASHASTTQAADLLRLVASLRDPHDISLAELWRACIRDLTVTVRQEHHDAHITDIIDWDGRIVFSDLTENYAIRFAGSRRQGAGAKVDERVDALVKDLLDGIPFAACQTERKPVLKGRVAERFGQEPRRFLLGSCLDPRITRTAAHLLREPQRTDHDLSAALDEPTAFIARIRAVYSTPARADSTWLQQVYELVTRWHVEAATRGGLADVTALLPHCASSNSAISTLMSSIHSAQWTRIEQGKYRLAPCTHCGGHRRAPMRNPEPHGLVCLDCRRDEQGPSWPADPYDQWRCAASLWSDPLSAKSVGRG